MRNIRQLKKELQQVKNELEYELVIYKSFHPDFSFEKAGEIMKKIEDQYRAIIYRIQHPPKSTNKGEVKQYFNSIVDDINQHFITILDDIEK